MSTFLESQIKMLLIGSQGFLGRYFLKRFPQATVLDRPFWDLANPPSVLPKGSFTHAVIAAAIGNPKQCETNPSYSHLCNVTGTLKLCDALLSRGITPVVFSSDYVFSGSEDSYGETAVKAPLNQYGLQKSVLEESAPEKCLILRLSKVYGTEKAERSMLDEMASLFSQGKEVKAAADQIFAPVHVNDVVDAASFLMAQNLTGLFNLAGEEVVSRFEIALRLAKKMNTAHLVRKISLDDLQEPFKRPKKTVLNSAKLKHAIQHSFRSLESSLDEIARPYETH